MASKEKKLNENKPFLALSSKATLGLSGVLLFSYILIFILGTLVGRGSIKVDLGKEDLALEIADYSKETAGSEKIDSQKGPSNKSDFIFYEALKQSEKPKPVKKQPVKHKIKSVRKKKNVQAKPPSALEHAKTPKKAEDNVKKSPPPKDPQVFKYTIQAASFKTPQDAGKMVDKLKKNGYPAYTVKALVRNNELWYRVWIGSFRDRIHAKKTLGRLKKDNIEGFLVNKQEKR